MARLETIKIPHGFSQTEVVRRFKQLIPELIEAHAMTGATYSWSGSTCSFKAVAIGFLVEGTIRVLAHEVVIDGTIQFQARPYRVKIEKLLADTGHKLLQ